jgi:hypothetical protein
MSLDTGRYQLYSAFKNIQARWENTLPYWDDVVRRDFEEEFWNPLEPRMQLTLSAIDRLGQIINRVRQECR